MLNVAKTNFSQLHGFRTINISAAIDAAGGVIDTSAAVAAANGLVMCRSDEYSSNDGNFIAIRVD